MGTARNFTRLLACDGVTRNASFIYAPSRLTLFNNRNPQLRNCIVELKLPMENFGLNVVFPNFVIPFKITNMTEKMLSALDGSLRKENDDTKYSIY